MNYFEKIRQLWKLILPFLLFLIISFSLIMGLLTFVFNIQKDLIYVWENGHFRNIEWRGRKFSGFEKENSWQLRNSTSGQNFLYDYLEENLTIDFSETDLENLIEEIGDKKGNITSEIKRNFPEISSDLIASENLQLKYYNYNVIENFIVNKVYEDFPDGTNVFSTRKTSSRLNDLNKNEIEFFVAPQFDDTRVPKYLQWNSDTDFHVFKKMTDEEIKKLNNEFIFVTPSDLIEFNLNIGSNYIFSLNGTLIETTVAGTAVSKTSVKKTANINSFFAPYSFLQKYNLIDGVEYGIYLSEAGYDFRASNNYFNAFLNTYFVNDGLDIHIGSYVNDPEWFPYLTQYKIPLEVFYTFSSLISFFVILLIVICYSWISIYTIQKQKETLWNFKANGASNLLLASSQIIGDLIPQFIAFLLAVPLGFFIYQIFWSVGSTKYVFDLMNIVFNWKAFLIGFATFLLSISIYLFANFFIIKNKLKINTPIIGVSIFYKKFNKIFASKRVKISIAISWPNIGKSLIFGVTMFLTFLTIEFGLLLTSSLKESSLKTYNYMLPYKNASGQYLENTDTDESLGLDQYESINFDLLKEAYNENSNVKLLHFIANLQNMNPLSSKIESEDLKWFLNLELTENFSQLEPLQSQIKLNLNNLNWEYDGDFYPEIYFKNYPKLAMQSSLNLKFSETVTYNLVLLKDDRQIFKDFELNENEVIVTDRLMWQFYKWNRVNDGVLSMLIDDKAVELKVKAIEPNLNDNYYIFGNYNYIIENYYGGIGMKDNVFYSRNENPLITEMIALKPIESNSTGDFFSDYFDSEELSVNGLDIFITDYLKYSEILLKNAQSFSGLPIYSSYILIVVSFILIIILITLTTISNYEVIRNLKQLGYKTIPICNYISFGYIFTCFISLVLTYSIIGKLTQNIVGGLNALFKMTVDIYYDPLTFVVPLVIFLIFTTLIYSALVIYSKKVRLN